MKYEYNDIITFENKKYETRMFINSIGNVFEIDDKGKLYIIYNEKPFFMEYYNGDLYLLSENNNEDEITICIENGIATFVDNPN